MEVIDYLIEGYKKTGWPYFTPIEIINEFGESGRKQLNELRLQGRVERHIGVNQVLIKLICDEQKKEESGY